MSDGTKIAWTEATWNPIRARRRDGQPNKAGGGWACQRVSPGCVNCYAAGVNKRLGTGLDYDARGIADSDIYLDERILAAPLRWKRPRRVFVCSMTDVFAEWVPDEWLDRIFAVMALASRHKFQLLTKRPERMREYLNGLGADTPEFSTRWDVARRWLRSVLSSPQDRKTMGRWEYVGVMMAYQRFPLPNVWLGVSVENQRVADERIPELLGTPAAVRWLSCEPLLEPVDIRQHLEYHPVHETATNEGERSLRRGDDGGTRSGHRREGVANGASPLEPLDERVRVPSGDTSSSGESDHQGLPPGQGDARWEARSRAGASTGIPPLLWTDSAGNDDQPQVGHQERQPSRESGAGDAFREHSSLAARPEARTDRSAGNRQRDGEVDGGTGSGDPDAAHSGRKAGVDSGRLRRDVPDGLEDSSRGPLGLSRPISWIVVGGESGSGARACNVDWIRGIVQQCQAAGVPVFVKQMGSNSQDALVEGTDWRRVYRDRAGGDPVEWPASLRVRQSPEVGR